MFLCCLFTKYVWTSSYLIANCKQPTSSSQQLVATNQQPVANSQYNHFHIRMQRGSDIFEGSVKVIADCHRRQIEELSNFLMGKTFFIAEIENNSLLIGK